MPDETLHLIYQNPTERLDKFLTRTIPGLSRSQARRLIDQGLVEADNQILKPSSTLPAGTEIRVSLSTPQAAGLIPQNIPLEILFEDEQLVVLNKPAGLVVHPGAGHSQQTLVNALLYRYPEIGQIHPSRPGIVHRLDKETSGVIVVARTERALQQLQTQFKSRTVQKVYLALVHGRPAAPTGVIDVPIGRHPQYRQRMAALTEGKPAQTHYQTMERFKQFSLLQVGLKTGRTHQIRVHLAWLGHPVAGDQVYGHRTKPEGLSRQFLHAAELTLSHPISGKSINIAAPLPADLKDFLETLD